MSKRIDGNKNVAIAYLRVSTGKQELGLAAQRMAIESWAQANGVEIAAFCQDEGVSGATPMEDRLALTEAFSRISEHKAGLLLIARRDRLSRDVTNAGLIERVVGSLGASIVSVDGAGNGDSPTDEFTRNILNAVGQLERRIIAARTKAALAAKKAKGERLGRPTLAETLSADTIRLISELYSTGRYSQDALAAKLNAAGVATASGKGSWRKNTVQKALKAASL
jgi:DNA invertase Pin-like site-specific DNA recombinase